MGKTQIGNPKSHIRGKCKRIIMNIGTIIRKALMANEVIHREVEDRIYPILAPAGVTKYPYIIYRTKKTGQDGTKDGDEVLVSVALSLVGRSYDTLAGLSDLVTEEIELGNNDLPEDTRFVSYDETYLEELDAYAIALNFNFITN